MAGMNSPDDIRLMIETAGDLVRDLLGLSSSLENRLDGGAPIDDVISILEAKKERVDTLKRLCMGIRTELHVDQDGRVQTPIPEDIKVRFADLMMSFQKLIDIETRLEQLLCSKGIPIAGGTK